MSRQGDIGYLYSSQKAKIVYACAGGGTELISTLFSVPGASSTMLEASVLYDPESFCDYIGHYVEQYVKEETVRSLLGASYSRACKYVLGKSLQRPMALVVSAALATNRVRRGDDHAYIGYQIQGELPMVSHVTLDKEEFRSTQGEILSDFLLKILFEVVNYGTQEAFKMSDGKHLVRGRDA